MAARRPDFIAYSVTQVGARSRFREVGVAFWNQKRTALTVLLDAAPLSGRVVLSAPREERAAREPGGEG
jgi:hypothetical protein